MQGQKVSTHPSLVRVHVSASQRRRAVDGEPAAIALCRRRAHETFQRGAGGNIKVRSSEKVQQAISHPLRTGKEQSHFSGALESTTT